MTFSLKSCFCSIIGLLMIINAYPMEKPNNIDKALLEATDNNDTERIASLLAEKANVNTNSGNITESNEHSYLTPLMISTKNGNKKIIQLLISHNADVNTWSTCTSKMLLGKLFFSAKNPLARAIDCCTESSQTKYYASIQEGSNKTALKMAVDQGNVAIAKLLIDNKASLDCITNFDGATNPCMLELLTQHHAPNVAVPSYGKLHSVLIRALEQQDSATINALLNLGIRVEKGRTEFATWISNPYCSGEDFTISSRFQTPYEYYGKPAIKESLALFHAHRHNYYRETHKNRLAILDSTLTPMPLEIIQLIKQYDEIEYPLENEYGRPALQFI